MNDHGHRNYESLIHSLYEEKERIESDLKELNGENMRESLGELSLADNHPADIGTELYQRERDAARRDGLVSRGEAINRALDRWEQGKYGICEHCGQLIPMDRLETIPYTTMCAQCSAQKEKNEHHSFYRNPVEDELLYPPFEKKIGYNGEFDQEDAWQAVARYGTADSLQDLGTNQDIEDPAELYEESDEWIGAVEEIELIPTEEDNQGESVLHFSRDRRWH